jgi:hypothetical protein
MYSATRPNPESKNISTIINRSGRSPRLDILMADHELQPYIHDAIVTVVRNVMQNGLLVEKKSSFVVFFKNHKRLHINRYFQDGGITWYGDMVVMKIGARVGQLVGLRTEDIPMSDFLARR